TDSVLSVDRWIVFQAFMQNEIELDKATHVRIMKFRNALMQLENQWIALIKIPDVKVQADLEDPSHDYLTMLFDRISSGGTRLSPDELLFSMIKQSWPDAHNIVYRLQEEVGSLMKPTDFVMTAFRLAMLQSNDSKDPELSATMFHKHLAGLLGNDDTSVLRKMISEGGTLVTAFKTLIEIIEYRDDNDAGIPKLMFPYLNESMLQVILYWLVRNQNDNVQESRDEIIRFILFWFVCHQGAKSAYTASKTAIEIISKTTGGFPSKQIYQELTKKDDNGVSLFHPLIDLSNNLLDSSVFHTPLDREKKFFGEQHVVLYRNFTSRIDLLLWLQRKSLKQTFKDFIPLAGQDDDNVPYDLDHLVPQSNWSSLNGLNREGMTQENRKIFENLYYRRMLGNSIGNYRVLSSSVNRSRGDEPLGNELVDLKIQWDDYALDSNDEIEFQKWKQASPISKDDGFKWNDERLLAFQYAVESRVLYLYKRYFDEMKFRNWL
ncbi:MAG: hypothetical protein Q8Q54_11105, partial [Methylococcales bacterium]|nr:hypothetical protein [Methylococcales bacterium]